MRTRRPSAVSARAGSLPAGALLVAVAVAVAWSAAAPAPAHAIPVPTTVRYGAVTRTGMLWASQISDVWNLTRCDLVLGYRLSMGGYRPPFGEHRWTSVGLGSRGSVLGWISSAAPYAGDQDPNVLDLDDKFTLAAPGRLDENSYDALGPSTVVGAPIGTPHKNHGLWFDRSGVDPYQERLWGVGSGTTYNTGGNYVVEVTYHAVTPSAGTMFARVNGVATGIYDGPWRNAQPDFYPVGKSFTGQMTYMRVFTYLAGYNVRIMELTVRGCR